MSIGRKSSPNAKKTPRLAVCGRGGRSPVGGGRICRGVPSAPDASGRGEVSRSCAGVRWAGGFLGGCRGVLGGVPGVCMRCKGAQRLTPSRCRASVIGSGVRLSFLLSSFIGADVRVCGYPSGLGGVVPFGLLSSGISSVGGVLSFRV